MSPLPTKLVAPIRLDLGRLLSGLHLRQYLRSRISRHVGEPDRVRGRNGGRLRFFAVLADLAANGQRISQFFPQPCRPAKHHLLLRLSQWQRDVGQPNRRAGHTGELLQFQRQWNDPHLWRGRRYSGLLIDNSHVWAPRSRSAAPKSGKGLAHAASISSGGAPASDKRSRPILSKSLAPFASSHSERQGKKSTLICLHRSTSSRLQLAVTAKPD